MEGGKLPHVPEEVNIADSLFPLTFHPRHAVAKEELHAWAEKTLNPHEIEALNQLRIDELACTMWPMALAEPPTQMLALCQFMFWLFLLDDMELDACIGEEGGTLQVESMCRRVLDAMFGDVGKAPPSLEGKEPACIAVAREWWTEVKKSMPRSQQDRFQAATTAYVHSLAEERRVILATETGPAPSVEEYAQLRYDTFALPPFYVLIEYSLGIELDEDALQSSLLHQLHQAAGEFMFCVNDMVSFAREFEKEKNAVLNIVNRLHARNCEKEKGPVPIHEAVSQVWRMIQERHLDCARLAQEIAASPPLASKPDLQRYVKSLCLATIGCWAWHLRVERYKPDSS